jgi:hypothetical protein
MAEENVPSFEEFVAQNLGAAPEVLMPSEVPQGEAPSFYDFVREQEPGLALLMGKPERAPAVEPMNNFSRGAVRGWYNFKSGMAGTAGAVTDLFGWDEATEGFRQDYHELIRAAEEYKGDVQSVEEVDSFDKFASWAAGVLGEQVVNVVGFMATRGVGGLLARTAARSGTSKLAQEQVLARLATASKRGKNIGGLLFASSLEGGHIYGEQLEAGVDTNPLIALLGGVAAGSLEQIPLLTMSKMLGLEKQAVGKLTGKIMKMPWYKRMPASGMLIGTQEAGTEVMQEVIALTARELVDENFEMLGEEGVSRLLNSAAAGFVGGAGFGFPAGIRGGVSNEEMLADKFNAMEQSGVELAPHISPVDLGEGKVEEDLATKFGQYSNPSDSYIIGEGLIHKGEAKKIIEDITEYRPVMQREGRVSQDEAKAQAQHIYNQEKPGIVTSVRQEARAGSLYANTRVKGTDRRYGKSLQKLLDSYNEVVEGDGNYLANGQLKPGPKKRAGAIKGAIQATSDRTGIPVQGFEIAPQRPPIRASEPSSEMSAEEFEAELVKQAVEKEGTVLSQLAAPEVNETLLGIPEEDIISTLRTFVQPLKVLPKYKIVHSLDLVGTPFANQASTSKALFRPSDGMVYLIKDNINSVEALEKTLLHETMGHFGLRAYLGEKELNTLLDFIIRTRGDAVAIMVEKYKGVLQNKSPQDIERIAAEEYITSIAESGSDMSLLKKVIAKLRRVLRKIYKSFSFSDDEIRLVLQDINGYLRGTVISDNRTQKTYISKSNNIYSSLAATQADNMGGDLELKDANKLADAVNDLGSLWGIKFKNLFLTPLQLAEKYNITQVRTFVDEVQKWWNTKSRIISEADEVAVKFRRLGKTAAQKVSNALIEISNRSYERDERIAGEELEAMLRNDFKLAGDFNDPTSEYSIYFAVDRSLQSLLDRFEQGQKYNAVRETVKPERVQEFLTQWDAADVAARQLLVDSFVESGEADVALFGRLMEIENQINEMRNRNYFPMMRFGKYTVAVRAKSDLVYKGEDYVAGDMMLFEAHELAKYQEEAFGALGKEFKGVDVQINMSQLSDVEYAAVGMPPALYAQLQEELDLTDTQLEQLKDIYLRHSPGQSFMKRLRRRRGIDGFSMDAMRVYSNYMFTAAGYIARVEHRLDMRAPLDELQRAIPQLRSSVQDDRGLIEILDYFNKHYDYLMKPENDWAQLRALGFIFYLGFSPKAAMVNATQIPMVTYPFLAAQYGDKVSINEITKAYGDVVKFLRGKGEKVLSGNDQWMFEEMLRESVLDESQVTELAGMGEAPTLFRIMPESSMTRNFNKFSYAAGWMFRNVEIYNRRVTALAAFRLALRKSGDRDAAYKVAKEAVQKTQYEYAKWNRASFMRGKKSVIFLFYNYLQHTLYLLGGNEGSQVAGRMWFMLLMASGMLGAPFAEDLLDLIDWGATEVKEMTGMKNPRVDLRADLRELLVHITDHPDMLMHGLGRYYGLGPLHLLSALGVPVPNVNIAGSIGMGRITPGLDDAMRQARTPEEKFGRTLVGVMGPVGAMGYNIWKAVESNDPDTWKRFERAMPIAMKAASKALRVGSRGEETLKGGANFMDYDLEDPEQLVELATQMIGFNPTRMAQKYEMLIAQRTAAEYWHMRRSVVMANLGYAIAINDREGIADARKALRKYNASVSHRTLRITSADIRRSMKARKGARRKIESGQPRRKRDRAIYHQVGEQFPEVE